MYIVASVQLYVYMGYIAPPACMEKTVECMHAFILDYNFYSDLHTVPVHTCVSVYYLQLGAGILV